ncbi:uncharacterized protein VTP21DRAFT_9960 [Calcarisporiella thermophila]|uniref:uncharacterized protein n=1 Tax=Calcarisporiella thermophila TaxID=911321 RepID=UPI0037444638
MNILNPSTWKDIFSIAACCFPSPTLNINRRTFRILKLLGEGGFSYVYLVQDASTGRQYALKKIRCPFGTDSLKAAMKEVDMYRMFNHPNIIRVLDTCVVQDKDGSKVVYIFMPYFKRGNIQDAINNHLVNKTHYSEREILRIFRGVCYAVRALHTYQLPDVPFTSEPEANEGAPLNTSLNGNGENEDRESGVVPYAHRDVKPGNILIADDGTPILMDFGSVSRARIEVRTRQEALTQQDLAAEHCTMPYRAPELFDVKTGSKLDEKVDIWSLGCTLYAMAYGQSPFEANMNEQGGSMALAVLNGQFRFPTSEEEDRYSRDFRALVQSILVTEANNRPDIHQVIERVDQLMETLDQ